MLLLLSEKLLSEGNSCRQWHFLSLPKELELELEVEVGTEVRTEVVANTHFENILTAPGHMSSWYGKSLLT